MTSSCHEQPSMSTGLSWSNITFDIPQPKSKSPFWFLHKTKVSDTEKGPVNPETKQILHGLSGEVRQGEFVGLLGASGAGKTTLLNILSGRLGKLGKLHGQVTYMGRPREQEVWKHSVGYVEQDDAMLSRVTVRETIETAAQLRLPNADFTADEKTRRVDEIIEMLRLEDCQDTRVGSQTERGVSGGERKRTSIGVELVSNVSLLFLDEPTSGLDAYAAYRLIDNISQVVKHRHLACFMTIHQPSWAMFSMLDQVILLAKGSVFYNGPPSAATSYFDTLGYRVPDGTNPADHFISMAENLEATEEGERRIQRLIDSWKDKVAQEKYAANTTERLSSETLLGVDSPECDQSADELAAKKSKKGWPNPWTREFRLMLTRWSRESMRDKQTLIATIGQTVFTLILIGFAFFRLGRSQSAILARIGVLFFIPINAGFSVGFPLITSFPVLRALMKRERASGLYRTSSFFLAKIFVEIPKTIVQYTIFYTILYFMLGLRLDVSAFFIFLGVNYLHLLNGIAFGLAIGAVSPTIDIANILAPILNITFLLFGGNLLPDPPVYYIWLKYMSPINYSYAALAINEMTGETYTCDGSSTGQCYRTGEEVLEAYHLKTFTLAENVGLSIAITMVFFVLGWAALRWAARPQLRLRIDK